MKGWKKASGISICGFIMFISMGVGAQNLNFSQYGKARLFTNPALVGTSSELSVSIINRNQQLLNYSKQNTTSLTVLLPLVDTKSGNRWGGVGISAIKDEFRDASDFQVQGIAAAYAYNLMITRNHFLSFAMQGGYFQRQISTEGYTTSSQWIPDVGYDPSSSLGEIFPNNRSNVFSIGSGFVYYIEDENQRKIAQVGLAGFHLNKPNGSFTAFPDIVPIKYSAQASFPLMQSETFLVTGEMLYYRENNLHSFYPGARVGYYFESENPYDILGPGRVEFKSGYRLNNAVIFEMQFIQPNFSVGFSYDFLIETTNSPADPYNVTEFSFSLRKLLHGKKKENKPLQSQVSYHSLGEVREFYINEKEPATSTTSNKVQLPGDLPEGEIEFKLKQDFKFGFNEARLNEEAKAYLDDLAQIMRDNEQIRLEVLGHTDNVGSAAANKRVSYERARIVIEYLETVGIDKERMTEVAKSDTEPLAPNDTEENKARNRRVEFVIRGL